MQIYLSNYSRQEIHSLLCKVPPPHHPLISHNRIKDTIHANFTEFWLSKLYTSAHAVMLCRFMISLPHPLTNKQLWLSANDHLHRWKENVSLPEMVVRRLSPLILQRERPAQCQPRSFYGKPCYSHVVFTLQVNPSISLCPTLSAHNLCLLWVQLFPNGMRNSCD